MPERLGFYVEATEAGWCFVKHPKPTDLSVYLFIELFIYTRLRGIFVSQRGR